MSTAWTNVNVRSQQPLRTQRPPVWGGLFEKVATSIASPLDSYLPVISLSPIVTDVWCSTAWNVVTTSCLTSQQVPAAKTVRWKKQNFWLFLFFPETPNLGNSRWPCVCLRLDKWNNFCYNVRENYVRWPIWLLSKVAGPRLTWQFSERIDLIINWASSQLR